MSPMTRQFVAVPAPLRAMPTGVATVPPPGSEAAKQQQCCCPPMDNCHGQGFILNGRVAFIVNLNCSLHGGQWEGPNEPV